jgi:tripartite-type tricarboxylate transporter receptor subunit TctC
MVQGTKRMKRLTTHWLVLAALLLAAPMGKAHAQSDYPSRPVRIINDSAAGSANDSTTRILGDKLSRIWGQQVITINQPGAGGGLSAKAASQSPNDGYTLYVPATSPFLSLPGGAGVAPNLPLELPRDFTPIGFVLQQPMFIGASHKSGIDSVADIIRMAKEKPGIVSYAATGVGRLSHLTMELLQARTGIKLQLVPYTGGTAQSLNDVMSGRVELVLDAYAGLAASIQGNLIKGVADTALERLPGFESLPTVAETVPGFFVGAWAVMVAPVGTPDMIVRKVNADLWTALNDPEVKTKFQANGAFLRKMTPEEVVAFVRKEQETWRPILEQVARATQK